MTKSQLTDWFETEFWPLYLELVKTPFKTQFGAGVKGEALKSMTKLNPSESIRERMIKHLADQIVHRRAMFEVCRQDRCQYEQAVKYNKFYCNRHGKTWINNMGWVDDFPELEKPKRERQQGNIAHREWTGFEWNKGHD